MTVLDELFVPERAHALKVAPSRQVVLRFAGEQCAQLVFSFFSSEGWVRTYQESGKVLLSSTPYWRYRIAAEKEA